MSADFRDTRSPDARRGSNAPPPTTLDVATIRKAVLAGDPAGIDEGAEKLAEALSRAGFTTSQVRNFYGSVAKIRDISDPARQIAQIRMTRSRLAYLTARSNEKKRDSANHLWAVFGPLTKEVQPAQVAAFCDFAEAVVAYHKFYEKSGQADRRG